MQKNHLFFVWQPFILFILFLSLNLNAEAQQKELLPAVLEMPEVVAEVNGDKIMKTDLAAECLRLHGTEELKDLVKKFLIQLECSRLNIVVTQQEINNEVERMAKAFKFSTQDWLDLLEKERGMTAEMYMEDIIQPILAIGKLAGVRMNITEEEIQREMNARYGAAVQVRQIVLGSRKDAEKVWVDLNANPESFPSVAKNRSLDPASQPYGGLIHPIRQGSVNPEIEKIVFGLKSGEISPIVEWPAGQFLIFRCEQHLQPQNVDKEKVREQLVTKIRDMKTRSAAEDVFRELQSRAQIEIIFGNSARMAQVPGVVAVVNGQSISQKYLAEICLKRYGKPVLSDIISKLVVEQACRKQNIVITDTDIDREIREMAIKYLPLQQNGSPNIELWMKMKTEESRTTPNVYRTNTVWPVLALKRLSRPFVQVTEEDIQRGFESNFGKKIRCLAIVFDPKDQRRAQEVWEMANRNRTSENFKNLAEKYSMDPESRIARGVIPPISRYSGQPTLENEAFGLLPNELSQLIQVDENWVILYCLGYEEPSITNINDVKADLVADIFEKKQNIAVEKFYENLFNQAAIDNYLTGESRNPEIEKAIRETEKTKQATGIPTTPVH
ncbi:MAG: peptidylprolyl isomerase [Planctomycetaceae bacterium]|jgi:parvulin-like peptidyl-prolyl isomerase|nr:peptidylprolyl isomerase [Planctomycetaceae bacterium]